MKSTWWSFVAAMTGLWPASNGVAALPDEGPLVGKEAPQFAVRGIYQESYSLETFKGHILVMQFGTSW